MNQEQKLQEAAVQIAHEISIKYLHNGQIKIEGPIHDPALMLSLMGHAFLAWSKFMAEQKEAKAGRIVKPPANMILPGRK